MPTVLDKFKMQGQVALITGAAGLLGRQFALALAQAGAAVMLADLASDQAAEYAAELQAQGFNAAALRADVTELESAQAMVAVTLAHFGRLDVLINSAALDPSSTLNTAAARSRTLLRPTASRAGARPWT